MISFRQNFLEDCINYYIKNNGNLEKNIANYITILDKFIKSLNLAEEQNLGVTIFEYIVLYIIKEKNIFTNKLYFIENNENKTLFHVISQYNECETEILKRIISKYDELKRDNFLKKLGKLFCKQDIEGKTILMNCLENHQLELAQKIIIDLEQYLDFNLYDIKGNTLLHYLFRMKREQILIKKGELELILNICLLIINKSPILIITQNFEGYTPWLYGAKAGIPGSLLLMSKFYNPSKIEKYSRNTSAIHEAAKSNKEKILKCLVEYYGYDINSKIEIQKNENLDGNGDWGLNKFVDIVPLHFAARAHSLNSFKILIEMGANPYIKNYEKKDSISILLNNCNEYIFDFLINSRIFKANFYNGRYLIDLLSTSYGIKHIINYLKKNGFNKITLSNKNNQDLFLSACTKDNADLIKFLLENNFNIETKDIADNTPLHYLAKNNSINCGYLFLDYLEKYYKNDLYKFLNAKNKSGNTAFHLCCIRNQKDFLYILIEFIIKNNLKIQFEKNNEDLNPIQIALLNQNYQCAKLIYDVLNLTEEQVLQIRDEYKTEIINNFKEMKNCKNNLDIKKQFQELIKIEKRKEVLNIDLNKICDKNNYEKFVEKISKYYELKNCNKSIYLKYESIFGHSLFLNKLYNLAENGLGEIVDFFFKVIDLKIDMNKTFNKLVKFYIGFIFINCEYSDFPSVLNNLEYVLFSYLKNLEQNHPIFNWIQSIIISYYQYNEKIDTNYIINLIKDFINMIYKLNLIDVISFTSHSDITYRFIQNLIYILKNMDNETAFIQIKRLNMIPPLLKEEIKDLKSKNRIINNFSFSENPIHEFCSNILKDKHAPISYIDCAIEFTIKLEQSEIINYKTKEKIIDKINYFKKEIKDSDLNYFFDYFEKIISLIGNNAFIDIINDLFKSYSRKVEYKTFFDIMHHLSLINDINEFNEKLIYLKKRNYEKFFESSKPNILYNEKEIPEIIENFKKVDLFNNDKIYSLPELDLEQLNEFGKLIQKGKYYSKNQLKTEGQKLGQKFRLNPNLENLSNLMSIIISGAIEVMQIKPYLVQTLSVASFCLYFINDNLRNTLKGRIAQIATGEGKTLIIVMLALITSLQGYFTDIITSNSYLSKFAQRNLNHYMMLLALLLLLLDMNQLKKKISMRWLYMGKIQISNLLLCKMKLI